MIVITAVHGKLGDSGYSRNEPARLPDRGLDTDRFGFKSVGTGASQLSAHFQEVDTNLGG